LGWFTFDSIQERRHQTIRLLRTNRIMYFRLKCRFLFVNNEH